MITEERQNALFESITSSLNECHSKKIFLNKPILEEYDFENYQTDKHDPKWSINPLFMELPIIDQQSNETDSSKEIKLTVEQEENLFDVLGCFNLNTPDRVFLCPKRINYLLKKWFETENYTSFSASKIEEVVYIHECAHYIHFHINGNNYMWWNIYDRKYYVETFAQLITHRITCSAAEVNSLQSTFIRLSENQEEVYIRYKQDSLSFHLFPASLVFEAFLFNLHSKNIESELLAKIENTRTSYFDYLRERYKDKPKNVSDSSNQKEDDSGYTFAEVINLLEDLEKNSHKNSLQSLTKEFIAPSWSVDLPYNT
jgi:hypothetical protein